MKIAVIGSRNFPDSRKVDVARFVGSLPSDTIIVSGGAKGVDQLAENAAPGRVFSFRTFGNDSDGYGVEFWDYGGRSPNTRRFDQIFADKKSALIYRDWLIAHECDELAAFWNGYSRGTQLTATFAKDLGKKVEYK